MTYGELISFFGCNNVQSLGKGSCHGLGGSTIWISKSCKRFSQSASIVAARGRFSR